MTLRTIIAALLLCASVASAGWLQWYSAAGAARRGGAGGTALPTAYTNLNGYWKFDEGTGTTTADSTANSNTATLVSSPIWTNNVPTMTFPDSYALTFDGSSAYVTVPNTAKTRPGTNEWTMTLWFRTSADAGTVYSRGIATYYAPNNSPTATAGYSLDILGSGYGDGSKKNYLMAFFRDDAGNYNLILSTNTVNNGNWHHAVLRRTASDLKLYLDGALHSTGTTATGNTTGTCVLYIGTEAGYNNSVPDLTRAFNGSVDDVRLYNRALTTTEINTLAGGGL